LRRTRIDLEDVAALSNLAEAAFRAARGKRARPDVASFLDRLDDEVAALRNAILDDSVELGEGSRFTIRDPKPRRIFAPCFRERVLHHAVMALVGPVLDRTLVADSFACRTGKGSLAAVKRAQQHVRRFPWYAKLDVRAYFASIDHAFLHDRLRRVLKGAGLLHLIERIIASHHDSPQKGLPIGSLTSQCFANFYLGSLDRFLLEQQRVRGIVRYMDDFVLWTDSRSLARQASEASAAFLESRLALTAKRPIQINRSARGVSVCGYRVLPGALRLSQRRRQRYLAALRSAEAAYRIGRLDGIGLQRRADAALAITAHADATAWRKARLAARAGTPTEDLI
jgi:RNA-directed DNA polymerase